MRLGKEFEFNNKKYVAVCSFGASCCRCAFKDLKNDLGDCDISSDIYIDLQG